ncbi:MAG: penicillin-binding protein 2 [Anaerolineae bacterium]
MLVVRLAIVAGLVIAGLRLWDLQIMRRQEFQLRADRQRFRIEAVDAPRGIFYDRNRRILVSNLPRYCVSLTWARLPDDPAQQRKTLERIASLLGIPLHGNVPAHTASLRPLRQPKGTLHNRPLGDQGERRGLAQARDVILPPEHNDLDALLVEARKRPFEAYPIAPSVDRQLAFIILEELPRLPGVSVQIIPTREYADGPLLAHLLGYMWHMPGEEVEYYRSLPNSDYTPNDAVGYAGLERTLERELRGHRGRRHVEVDVFGRQVSVLAVEPAQPGHSMVLTVDRDLQAHVEQHLRQGLLAAKGQSAVAIVMDPRTGEVLSMVSLPTYDNNLFAQGKAAEFAPLAQDPTQPMFNRAVGGQYPPGSTFKIIPAAAGLQERIIDANTKFRCEGTLALDAGGTQWRFYCWIHKYGIGHGDLNVIGAMAQSCDIFFYKLAGGFKEFQGLGLDVLNHYARMFGLGEQTGIELSGEARGLVPSAKWKRINLNESWTTGDTYNAAIGQGFVLATPLQMLNALCAVANGGTLYRPQLIREVVDAEGRTVRPFTPKVIRTLDVSPEVLAIVQASLREAVANGTAPLANLPQVPVAGKTGSAEFGVPDEKGERPTHAWFMAYAPADDPQVAVIVFIEGGGEGSSAAAPVAAQILRYYFGLPTSGDQPQ